MMVVLRTHGGLGNQIRVSSGLRTPELAEALHTSPKKIERRLKQLKENGLIEFRGATKTATMRRQPNMHHLKEGKKK
jgi:hypothetical protein